MGVLLYLAMTVFIINKFHFQSEEYLLFIDPKPEMIEEERLVQLWPTVTLNGSWFTITQTHNHHAHNIQGVPRLVSKFEIILFYYNMKKQN